MRRNDVEAFIRKRTRGRDVADLKLVADPDCEEWLSPRHPT
jgi:hypothetical protein